MEDSQLNKKQKISNTHDNKNKLADLKYKSEILKSSIKNDDTSYISEFLLQKDGHYQLKYLEQDDQEKLSILLLDFLDTPLRLLAINILKSLSCHKNVFKTLQNRAIDFNKMVYLKGKLDYIRHIKIENVKHEPEYILDE